MHASSVRPFTRRAAAVLGVGAVVAGASAQQSGVETIVVSDRASQTEIDLTPGGVTLLDGDELRELLVDAWRMCVPKKVAAAYDG